MTIKTDKKKRFSLSSDSIIFIYILRVKACIWKIWTYEKMLGKSVGKRNDAQYMLFCICPHTSHIQKFWDAYMIMNGNFMVIVELCNGDLILYAKHQETYLRSVPCCSLHWNQVAGRQ